MPQRKIADRLDLEDMQVKEVPERQVGIRVAESQLSEVHQTEPEATLLDEPDLKDRRLRAQSRTRGKAREQGPNQVQGQVLGQVRGQVRAARD